ncbi:hypothetical protein Trydic_g9586 [Trypoxylus dichotomus]
MEGVTNIRYANDVAVVMKAEDVSDLVFKTNESHEAIIGWMKRYELEVASQKSGAAILKGSGNREGVVFKIARTCIASKVEIKYLGVAHVKYATIKAESTLSLLLKIMQNVRGPQSKKRSVLGVPTWIEAWRVHEIRDMLERLQREILLRAACGYRTISKMAIQVVT